MKKILASLLFFTAITTSIAFSNPVSVSSTIEEAIIAIPELSAKNFNEIKTALSTIDGITVVGYCEQHKCFLLNFDTKKVESADQIARSIEALNPRYKTEIKLGTSINQILSTCTNYSAYQIDLPK